MAIIFKRKEAVVPATVAINCTEIKAELPKPKTILKFGNRGLAPVKLLAPTPKEEPTPMTERQQKNLVTAGLMEPSEQQYEPLMIGDRVTVTSTMCHWVKHYKAGDSGVVTMISNNTDPMGVNDTKYRIHVIKIDMPTESHRKGGTAALFRHEFEKAKPLPATGVSV